MKKNEFAMLWYLGSPSDKNFDIVRAVGEGLSYFTKKYGHSPTVIYVHPSQMENIKSVDILKVESKLTLPNNVVIATSREAYEGEIKEM